MVSNIYRAPESRALSPYITIKVNCEKSYLFLNYDEGTVVQIQNL
jgi:hypothetical protein